MSTPAAWGDGAAVTMSDLAGIGAAGAAVMSRAAAAADGAAAGRCSAAGRAAAGIGIDEWYDTAGCGAFIEAGGHTKVALQFPDCMLPDGAAVAAAVAARAAGGAAGDGEAPLVCILGDVTFGVSCVRVS